VNLLLQQPLLQEFPDTYHLKTIILPVIIMALEAVYILQLHWAADTVKTRIRNLFIIIFHTFYTASKKKGIKICRVICGVSITKNL